MKKLNITKEQFEKSRYFKNKYGTLEYVSESGNLYKTDKGKVLMFKEGFKDKIKGFGRTVGNFMGMFTKGTNVYVWHSGTGDWYDALDNNEPVWCGKIVERNASSGEYGIEISEVKSKDANQKLETGDSVDIYDVAGAYQSGTVSKVDGNMLYVARSVPSDNKDKDLMFKESFNIDDYDDMSEEDRPKFDIGEHVVLTSEFFSSSDSTMQKFPRTGWMVEDVRECKYDTDGHGKFEYYVVHDNPFRKKIMDDDIDYSGGWWVLEYEIDKEKSRERMWRESSKKFVKESGQQTLEDIEDIIDDIQTSSIFERDVESVQTKLQELKQKLCDLGLFNGEIEEDFDDFRDDAIDYAKHHNFNKQILGQDAVTLQSDIEWKLSGNEVSESSKPRFVKEADEGTEYRGSIISAYQKLKYAIRDYASILEDDNYKLATKIERKIYDLVTKLIVDTRN